VRWSHYLVFSGFCFPSPFFLFLGEHNSLFSILPSPLFYNLVLSLLPFLWFLWVVVFSLVIMTEPYAPHDASGIEPCIHRIYMVLVNTIYVLFSPWSASLLAPPLPCSNKASRSLAASRAATLCSNFACNRVHICILWQQGVQPPHAETSLEIAHTHIHTLALAHSHTIECKPMCTLHYQAGVKWMMALILQHRESESSCVCKRKHAKRLRGATQAVRCSHCSFLTKREKQ